MSRRRRPIAVVIAAAALAAGGAAALGGRSGTDASQPPARPGLHVSGSALRSGTIALLLTNDTDRPARLAQVAIDSGFVRFGDPAGPLAPHASARIRIPYPWVAGEAYDVKLLLDGGATLDYRIAPSSSS